MKRSLVSPLCSAMLSLLVALPVQGQSAVSLSLNGIYSYVFAAATIEDAVHEAHDQCVERGGTGCWTLLWSERSGYAAIALSPEEDGDFILGVGLGFDTPEQAAAQALEDCSERGGAGCVVEHTGFDPEG